MRRSLAVIFFLLAIGISVPAALHAQQAQIPETAEEGKGLGTRVGEGMLNAMKQAWEEDALPVLLGMWNWTRESLWDGFIFPFLDAIWEKGTGLFTSEVEKRTSTLGEELDREKQEVTEEFKEGANTAKDSLWERFQRLWKQEAEDDTQ